MTLLTRDTFEIKSKHTYINDDSASRNILKFPVLLPTLEMIDMHHGILIYIRYRRSLVRGFK
jgi:hypothetical protein